MKIVLATNNEHKAKEIKDILSDLKAEILTLRDFPPYTIPEEKGKTLKENALLKAKEAFKHTGTISVADDSGLEVDFLDKSPGVMSARFAGPGCTYKDNNVKLLSLMSDVPDAKRGATFRCVVAIVFDSNNVRVVQGKVTGLITSEERGEGGFGYDPVFYYPPLGKTFAQLKPDEKNKVSHRAVAFKKAKGVLEKFARGKNL
jgi:XTP/dITP diphosphohydrolase